MAQYNEACTDQIGMDDYNSTILSLYIADVMGWQDALVTSAVFPLSEIIGITETLDSIIKAQINLSDGIGIEDAFSFLIELIASDTIGISEDVSVYKRYAAQLIETLVIVGLAETQLTANNVLSGLIGIIEEVNRALDASILDKIGITEDITHTANLIGNALATLGLDDSAEAKVVLYMTLEEELGIAELIGSGAVVGAAIEEGLIISTVLLGPGGEVSRGWVMNSENFAVTTYSNFGFNSFAKVNGQYFGMKEDGLCLLDGATDNGAYIQSVLRTAKMDLGTSNIKTMTQFYIGFRGDGNPVLKVITDDASETWYDVTEQDTQLHTDRVSLAKGTAGRYWQLELVTTDSTKAEYDTIELFPMVWGRKV